MPNVSFNLTKREKEDLDRALRAAKLSLATTCRALVLGYFKVKASKRRMSGPRAASTAGVMRRFDTARGKVAC